MYFKMSSAISFNLDQSKILSSGNGLKKPTISTTFRFVAFKSNNEESKNVSVWKGLSNIGWKNVSKFLTAFD